MSSLRRAVDASLDQNDMRQPLGLLLDWLIGFSVCCGSAGFDTRPGRPSRTLNETS
jgi:hypothetical protein